MRKNYSCDRENVLKFEAEGQEFAKKLRSIEQFVQTVKGEQFLVKNTIYNNNLWEKFSHSLCK